MDPNNLTDLLNKINRDYEKFKLDEDTKFSVLKNQLRGHTTLPQFGPCRHTLSHNKLLNLIADYEAECAILQFLVVDGTNNEKIGLRAARREARKTHRSDGTYIHTSQIEENTDKLADRLSELF